MKTERSYTRITLALDILSKLKSGPFAGFHKLGIIKHQIDLYDTISISDSDILSITCNNPLVPCDTTNICAKVVNLVRAECRVDTSIQIHIEKNIPVMGGLAGGSANAATLLSMLNEHWKLDLSKAQMMQMSRKIGMDVAFYFEGGTAYDTETGEWPVAIPTDLEFTFILIIPEFGVSTKDAYQRIQYEMIGKQLSKTVEMQTGLSQNDKRSVIANMHNDFEISVYQQYPLLRKIKQDLVAAGCENAILSGSGSTVIGVAQDNVNAQKICKKLGYPTKVVSSFRKK